MTRTLKLALVASVAVHAAAFAVVCVVSGGESKSRVEEEPRVIMLVPVQEDFVVNPVEAPPPAASPPTPAPPPKTEPPPPVVTTAPVAPPPVEVTRPSAPEPEVKPAPTPVRKSLMDTSPAPTTNATVDTKATMAAAAPTRIATAVESNTQTNRPSTPVLITGRVKYRRAADPDYPPLARRRRQEGTVLLEVTISPTGRATSVVVKQSSSFPLLDRAAVEAVQSWEFEVATDVSVRAEIPVRFQLVK